MFAFPLFFNLFIRCTLNVNVQGPESSKPEVTCQSDLGSQITTGGGISVGYALPSWQSALVNAYFTSVKGTANAPVSGYSTSGRGYPDLSALANDYVVIGNNQLLAGTVGRSANGLFVYCMFTIDSLFLYSLF